MTLQAFMISKTLEEQQTEIENLRQYLKQHSPIDLAVERQINKIRVSPRTLWWLSRTLIAF